MYKYMHEFLFEIFKRSFSSIHACEMKNGSVGKNFRQHQEEISTRLSSQGYSDKFQGICASRVLVFVLRCVCLYMNITNVRVFVSVVCVNTQHMLMYGCEMRTQIVSTFHE